MAGNGAEVGIGIRNFAGTGRPVLLGITERLEMAGSRIAIVTDHTGDLVEVHQPSRGSVDPGGVTIERCPPVPLPAG